MNLCSLGLELMFFIGVKLCERGNGHKFDDPGKFIIKSYINLKKSLWLLGSTPLPPQSVTDKAMPLKESTLNLQL